MNSLRIDASPGFFLVLPGADNSRCNWTVGGGEGRGGAFVQIKFRETDRRTGAGGTRTLKRKTARSIER